MLNLDKIRIRRISLTSPAAFLSLHQLYFSHFINSISLTSSTVFLSLHQVYFDDMDGTGQNETGERDEVLVVWSTLWQRGGCTSVRIYFCCQNIIFFTISRKKSGQHFSREEGCTAELWQAAALVLENIFVVFRIYFCLFEY